jgi:hypothetical protein
VASLSCRVLGHRPRFWAEGTTLRWECDRDCTEGGSREYETAADAERYARALDREDRDDLGRRSILSLMPLRLIRRQRAKARERERGDRS